ncbi:hypothetical protein BDR04DRAFT_1089689 [Suillus decipiens]|nr:hypothetical protein BDR04DRAFT_1089689 [Suillus decipiens]
MYKDFLSNKSLDIWDTQHVELVVFNPDPLSGKRDGRFLLPLPLMELSPMILYMVR